MNKILFFLEKYFVAFFVLILGITLRFNQRTPVPKGNVIYAFWHRNMIPLLFSRKFEKVVILISSSKDGEIIAGPAKALGFLTARGSSKKGGTKAVKEMIKLSRKYSLAVTPDGPKGPREKIKDGLLYIAYFTKLPIIPIAVDIKWEKVFNSWDKFRLPKLFSCVHVTYGEPIFINSKDEIKAKVQEVQKAMDNLTEKNKI
ncbi:MAG: lysophospholipid acyltransferase family protein [Candidatus Cloacimonetes bacterium]|nr:lysophospholipid acyltransferase family protein [Candidatus Cloacimonadota bacterium]